MVSFEFNPNMSFQFILGKQHKMYSIQFSANKEQLQIPNSMVSIILSPDEKFWFIWLCESVLYIYIYICMSWDRKVWDRKLKNNSMSPERAHVWLSQITIKQQLYIVTQKKWEKQNKKMIIWMAFVVMYYE